MTRLKSPITQPDHHRTRWRFATHTYQHGCQQTELIGFHMLNPSFGQAKILVGL
jgi:hypothetical protein